MPLEREVVQLLRNSHALRNANFRVGTAWMTPRRLQRVAEAIEQDRIQVMHGRPTNGGTAMYDFYQNHIVTSSQNMSEPGTRGLMIHECVHAANDMEAYTISRLDDESCAFLTQMVYLRDNSQTYRDMPYSRNRLFGAFARAADTLRRSRPLSAEQVTMVRRAILNTSLYKNIRGQRTPYNGL